MLKVAEPIDDVARWAVAAARAADAKQGRDIVVLEVGEVLAIADYFVITSAGNARQVRTIAEEIERQVDDAGGPKPRRIEGLQEPRWVLMDYGDFVVHVFLQETREFYELERLWGDVPRLHWEAGAA
jgi:ribosome-associated protein